ncbi:phage holin family protein [soil metagenome]
MRAQMGALLQAGLALKLNQVKRATSSYVRDRAAQSEQAMVSYAVAGGLYAAAGIFVIALLLVGATAMFRWVELKYGLFQAFGATAGLLLVLALLCTVLASSRLKRKAKPLVSLSSRLRVAIKANPIRLDQADSARDTAAGILATSPSPSHAFTPSRSQRRHGEAQPNNAAKAGLVVAATLMGWALARRRSLGKRSLGKANP